MKKMPSFCHAIRGFQMFERCDVGVRLMLYRRKFAIRD